MNNLIFTYFYNWSHVPYVGAIAVFASGMLTYILYAILGMFVLLRARPLIFNGFLMIGSAGSAWLASKILKSIFHIPRPFVTMHLVPLVSESGFSMPSSHATVFATLSVIAYYFDRRLGVLFIICTLGIGLSRIVLGVHYPLDVLVGFMLGALIGIIFIRFLKHPMIVAFFKKSL